jgi:hypothetical protein
MKKSTKKRTTITKANFEGLIDLVEYKGKVVYFLKHGDGERYSITDRVPSSDSPDSDWLPPRKDQVPWLIPKYDEVKEHLEENDRQLYNDLIK